MKSFSCDQMCRLVSDLLAGAVEPADAEAVEAHLARCLACRAQAEAFIWQDRDLAELAGQAFLNELAARIHTALTREAQPSNAAAPAGSAEGDAGKASAAGPKPAVNRAALNGMPAGTSGQRRAGGRRRFPALWIPAGRGWVVGAAAVLLVAAGLSFWLLGLGEVEGPSVPPRLEQVQGQVYVLIAEARTLAQSGQALLTGQGLQLAGEDSSAVVLYPDGTRLELGADALITELSDGQESGKRVFVASGSLIAEVTPQPLGRPMVLATPNAEVVIRGTRFTLSNEANATYVEVERGRVQLTRKSDGRSAELEAGFKAAAEANGVEPLTPEPLPPRFHAAQHARPGSWAALYSPDARSLVITRFRDGTVELLDAVSGQLRTVFEGHAHRVEALAFSPDGAMLATGGLNRAVKVWDVATGQLRATLDRFQTPVRELAFTSDGKTLVVLSSEAALEKPKTLTLWDVSTSQQRSAPRNYLNRFWALSPDGLTLATASDEGAPIEVALWDTLTDQRRLTLRGFNGRRIANLVFSPDGATLAVYTDCGGGTVTLWDSATGQARGTLSALGAPLVLSMAFSPDGKWLATGHKDATVRLCDLVAARQCAIVEGLPGRPRALRFGPGGKTLVASKMQVLTDNPINGAILLWDLPGIREDR